MTPHRPALAWIACLAVLFNLLVMPLSSAAPKGPAEQLLWGAFCSSVSSNAKAEIIALGKLDLGQHGQDHSNLQHCWCCPGAAPVLALPGHALTLSRPLALPSDAEAPFLAYQPTPRQQWPTLNPRASPLS